MTDSKIQSKVVNGVQYYSAYFSCPVCIERGTTYPPAFWVHSSCPNDHLYIGSDATLYCSGCGSIMKVVEGQYACPHHGTEGKAGEYVGIGDPLIMAEAMSAALALTKRAGREWVTRFLQAL